MIINDDGNKDWKSWKEMHKPGQDEERVIMFKICMYVYIVD